MAKRSKCEWGKSQLEYLGYLSLHTMLDFRAGWYTGTVGAIKKLPYRIIILMYFQARCKVPH